MLKDWECKDCAMLEYRHGEGRHHDIRRQTKPDKLRPDKIPGVACTQFYPKIAVTKPAMFFPSSSSGTASHKWK